MERKKLDFDFYFITDRQLSRKGVLEDVKSALNAGVRIVQYREKSLPTGAMVDEARKIAAMCKGRAKFMVNDRVDVALASGADGVHIGPGDMGLEDARKILGPSRIIGVTASSVAEAKRFEAEGADYIGLSPIFATGTKKDAGKPIGLEAVAEARKALRVPFVAIGGITRENLASVLKAGARSVAMISAVLKADDVEKEIREIRETIKKYG